MALFTKLFDRSHDPYSIPGARWYKIRYKISLDNPDYITTWSVISSDTDNIVIDSSSGYATFNGLWPIEYFIVPIETSEEPNPDEDHWGVQLNQNVYLTLTDTENVFSSDLLANVAYGYSAESVFDVYVYCVKSNMKFKDAPT